MAVVTPYIEALQAHVGRLNASVDGLVADVASLKAAVENALANAVSEDEKARLADVVSALDAVASRAESLDNETPPSNG